MSINVYLNIFARLRRARMAIRNAWDRAMARVSSYTWHPWPRKSWVPKRI